MTPAPGDLVGDRYELIRELGGGDLGRVFVARDRDVDREVALRVLESGDPGPLIEEARWMGDAHTHTPAAVAVLDMTPAPDGGGYVASELLAGTSLDELARRRAPLPAAEAVRYAIELLDAIIVVRRHVHGAADAMVASAMVGTDGRVRVTRFSRPPSTAGSVDDPAVVGTAQILRDLLSGGAAPPALAATIDDALSARIATPQELRGRILAELPQERPAAAVTPPPAAATRNRWPWILAVVLVVLAAVAAGLYFGLRDDGDRATVPDVAGFTAADAVDAVRAEGFSPRTVGHASSDVATGIVISTSPTGGQSAPTGSRVTISVSQGAGTVVVPTVIGLAREAAASALADAGLDARVIEQESASAPGTVISQDPSAGLQVPTGSTVAIGVSVPAATTATTTVTAPPTSVAVPDVIGLTTDEASARLLAANLAPGAVTEDATSTAPAGQIISQDPAAGTRLPLRTPVDVRVAAGG